MKDPIITIGIVIVMVIYTPFAVIWGALKGAVNEVKELWGMW
jgi:hypothetical protein